LIYFIAWVIITLKQISGFYPPYQKNMKAKTKKKIKEGAKEFMVILLETIKAVAEAAPRPFETKGEYQARFWRNMHGYPENKIRLGLYRLKKQGLVKENLKKKFVLELTLEGRHRLLIKKVSQNKTETKDGRSTLVIFDIPEKKSKYRAFLRRLLLKNEFMNLQESVMISKFDLPKEFFELLNELRIRQNVTVLKGQIQYL